MGLHSMIGEAKDPLTPLGRLAELSRSGDRDILTALARNPGTSIVTLEELMRSRQPGVLRALAKNSLATPNMLHQLAELALEYVGDPDEWEDREKLSGFDEDKHFVALEIASRTDTPERTFWKLLKHPSKHVRFRMAGNPAIPHGILVILSRDSDGTVRNRVADHPCISEYLAADILSSGSQSGRINLARNPSAPAWVLRDLANERDTSLTRGLLQNPSTPLEVLELVKEFILGELGEATHIRDSLVGYLSGHVNATPELVAALPVSGISHHTLERLYGGHPHWDALRVIFDDWTGTLGELVASVEAIEAL